MKATSDTFYDSILATGWNQLLILCTIPYSIKSAALPVKKGVAIEVPERIAYPPPGAQELISTPGAT